MTNPPVLTPAVKAARDRIRPLQPEKKINITIQKGRRNGPRRWFFYGPPGVGKTTLASNMPNPILLDAEGGANEIGVDRIRITCWEEAIAALKWLLQNDHGYESMATDTLDWLETYLFKYVSDKAGKKSISDFDFGAGYKEAMTHWREFQSLCEQLQTRKNMHIVLLAHATVKEHKNPIGDNYDEYVMKLYKETAAVMREWVSLIGFCQFETVVLKAKQKDVKGKNQSTGARVVYVETNGGFVAKNRYRMPKKVALDWNTLFALSERVYEDDNLTQERVKLRAEIGKLLPSLAEEQRKAMEEWLDDQALSVSDLQGALNRVTVIVNDSQQQEEDQEGEEADTTTEE